MVSAMANRINNDSNGPYFGFRNSSSYLLMATLALFITNLLTSNLTVFQRISVT